MKKSKMLLLAMSVMGFVSVAKANKSFATDTEKYNLELHAREGNDVEYHGYRIEQFSRDCHLGNTVLQERYPSIQYVDFTASEMLNILQKKHGDGKTSLEIVEANNGDLCTMLAQAYKNVITLSSALVKSGKGDMRMSSLTENEAEELLKNAEGAEVEKNE